MPGRPRRINVAQGGQELRAQQLAMPQFPMAPDIILEGVERQAAEEALPPNAPGQCTAKHSCGMTTDEAGNSVEDPLSEKVPVPIVACEQLVTAVTRECHGDMVTG